MKRFFRKVVDERQELEMMKVERIGFYVMVYSLAIVMFVQMLVFNANITDVIGSFIVLFIGAIWILIGCYRKGLYDYYSNPGLKSYAFIGGLTFIVSIILMFITLYVVFDRPLVSSLLNSVFHSFFIAAPTFIFMALYGEAIKKRRIKLQQKYKDESDM